jgi:hypothetical protein
MVKKSPGRNRGSPNLSVCGHLLRPSSWNESPFCLLNLGLLIGRSRFQWNTLQGVYIL